MTVEDVTELVKEAFAQAQESLVLLEEAAQTNDRPAIHALSQAYAKMLSPMRDYLSSVIMGRPSPRQLAKRIVEPADPIFELIDEVRQLGLQPDAEALTRLVQLAETVG